MSLFLITKIGVTVGIVLALSLAAERVSPRVAGVLAGYPLGAAIALFFRPGTTLVRGVKSPAIDYR